MSQSKRKKAPKKATWTLLLQRAPQEDPSLAIPALPHSWRLRDWPSHIAPGSPDSARNLIRDHQRELMAFGALTRVGRDIIILGAGYAAYLASGRDRVLGYTTTEKATQARAGAVG